MNRHENSSTNSPAVDHWAEMTKYYTEKYYRGESTPVVDRAVPRDGLELQQNEVVEIGAPIKEVLDRASERFREERHRLGLDDPGRTTPSWEEMNKPTTI